MMIAYTGQFMSSQAVQEFEDLVWGLTEYLHDQEESMHPAAEVVDDGGLILELYN